MRLNQYIFAFSTKLECLNRKTSNTNHLGEMNIKNGSVALPMRKVENYILV